MSTRHLEGAIAQHIISVSSRSRVLAPDFGSWFSRRRLTYALLALMRIEYFMQVLPCRLGCRKSIGMNPKGFLALGASGRCWNSARISVDNHPAFRHIESVRAQEFWRYRLSFRLRRQCNNRQCRNCARQDRKHRDERKTHGGGSPSWSSPLKLGSDMTTFITRPLFLPLHMLPVRVARYAAN
jgi:hypothetical protein